MDIESQIVSLMVRSDRGWECAECGYSTTNKQGLVNHIESKHVNIGGAQCPHCHKVCPTRHALQMHVSRQHQNPV